ncbi:MAG: hypothetical protein EBX52_09665, partial [Proteobacteria bacterium]|nr:hypothetical protein [Pseudomonadota bacterium]
MIGTVGRNRNHLIFRVLPALLVGMAAFASEFEGSIGLESQSSFSRLNVSIDSAFKADFQDDQKGFHIEFPAATLMDIGVPFGSEAAFNQHLKGLHDDRIDRVRVRELEGKLVIEGEYRFPKGDKAFASPKMEHFEFRKDEQGKLFVDFFYRKGPTRGDLARQDKALAAKKERERVELFRRKEEEKRASREKRIADGRNALLFCEQPYNRDTTVFLKFRPEHLDLNFSAYFPDKVPDHRFEYTDPKGRGEEFDMIRLAHKLSHENKHALVIKTVEFLEKEYPGSKLLNEMQFLKANAFYRLGFEEKGKELLQNLARQAKGTEVGLHAAGFLASGNVARSEWLAALQVFMNQKKEMPSHTLMWLFRFGIAESLYHIRQGEDAHEEYEWLAKNAPSPAIRAEAAFKTGDIYLERGQYAQAVKAYTAALKGRDAYLSSYPVVLLNLAEAYFQLDELQRAGEGFKRFLDVGPGLPSAWRASLRLAEISAMKTKLDASAEKGFMDTINRYPLSPGALVSRIRLLPCGSHGGFDLPAGERLLYSPEVLNFPGDGAIYSNQFRELVGLTEVRMMISFGEFQKAIERGLERLRQNPSVETRKLIEHAMIGGIKSILEQKLKDGDHFGAIAFYEKYGDFLPLPAHDPLADELKMKLATIAAGKNLTQFAMKLIEPYRRMNEASQKEVIAAIEKHLTLEGIDDQEERNLIEAKTLWNSPDFKIEDAAKADEFVARLSFIRQESKQAFEKNLLLALYHSQKKEPEKTFDFAKRLGRGLSGLKPREKVQVLAFMGEAAGRADDDEFAAKCWRDAR